MTLPPAAPIHVTHDAPRSSRTLAAVLCLVAVVGVAAGWGGWAARGQPAPPANRAADTTDARSSRSQASETDTVYVASGDVWAGTMEAQVRQRALFRATPSQTPSDEAPNEEAGTAGRVSIGGLVINDTRTTIGRDFYDVFYNRWETPEGAENVMVRVYEQPRPNVGTRILVDVEDETVFRANLRPRFEQIRRAARAALARAVRYLKQHYEPREVY